MKKVEQYIKDYTRNCSNLVYKDTINGKEFNTYNEWLTPDQARRAVEIAREETIKNVCKWLEENVMKYYWYDPYEDNEGYNSDGLIRDLKKHFEPLEP